MASGLLITAILIFAVRGMFLGLTGVIGRLVGVVLGYIVAYSFRHPLAGLVSQHTAITLPDSILQIISGLVLFVVTLFISGLVINAFFTLAGKYIPGVKAIVDKDTLGGKVAGASVNGLIGAGIVLIGLWGYGKVTANDQSEDNIQQFAYRFGDKAFSFVSDNTDLDFQTFSRVSTTTVQSTTRTGNNNTVSTTTGTATLVSSDDPSRSLSIDQIRQVIEQNTSEPAITGGQFSNAHLQSLLENNELRDQALKLLQDNPEQLQTMLNNPKLMALLKQLKTAEP